MDTQPAPKKILDANARRGAIIGGIALAVILVLFLIGKTTNLTDLEAVQTVMQDIASSPWALPALILLFVVGAFIGIPQFALLAISVAAFGPWLGALFGWIANMASRNGQQTVRLCRAQCYDDQCDCSQRSSRPCPSREHGLRGEPREIPALLGRYGSRDHSEDRAHCLCRAKSVRGPEGQSSGSHRRGVYIAIAAYARARMRKSGQSVALIGQNEVDRAATSDDVTSHVE